MNEAILLRVATLRVTLGLALQKLLLAGLHFPSSEVDRLLDKLNNMLGNAGDNVKARLEKCIAQCNRMWMEDSARQRKSLTDLLCGIEEDDDRVQEKRFPQVVALDDILTAPLEVLIRDRDEDHLSPANKLHRSCQDLFKSALDKFVGNGDCRANSRTCNMLTCGCCPVSPTSKGRLRFSEWFSSNVKTSSPATFFRRTAKAKDSTLPKLQRCKAPLSIMPRGTICVLIFSSRTTVVLCT